MTMVDGGRIDTNYHECVRLFILRSQLAHVSRQNVFFRTEFIP